MCLALIAINQHPLFPLIILSNRDEFYQRASAPADVWLDHPEIFAGLTDTTLAPDDLLPNTGMPVEIEKLLSAIFVAIPEHGYGTRNSSVLIFDGKRIEFFERTQ